MALASLLTLAHGPPPPPEPVSFNSTFSSYAVLQRAPAKSAVYGVCGTPADGSTFSDQAISVDIAGTTGDGSLHSYAVPATVGADGSWMAYLAVEATGGDFTVTATCTKGCANTTVATLEHVTFGDVWYCAGQYVQR
jgi:hypothetical protein